MLPAYETDPETGEPTNASRRERARAALRTYAEVRADQLEPEEALSDLLADLMHYCDAADSACDFWEAVDRASLNYDAEREPVTPIEARID